MQSDLHVTRNIFDNVETGTIYRAEENDVSAPRFDKIAQSGVHAVGGIGDADDVFLDAIQFLGKNLTCLVGHTLKFITDVLVREGELLHHAFDPGIDYLFRSCAVGSMIEIDNRVVKMK